MGTFNPCWICGRELKKQESFVRCNHPSGCVCFFPIGKDCGKKYKGKIFDKDFEVIR